ncbi:hypothetical protein ACIS_00732 [Anaplasma centrale str. Israel]|uniref:Uncharacterized protein n=1 Tax=Anaplasma centrale (strain Israel) TaxID=574556 RepID=D1AUR2_ANACI|nr:hypothetical protein [Anaplasma centrale]ACZ49290.1 hypothetical protein ACIS_00732 [Anaplasma centrale str. Israel]
MIHESGNAMGSKHNPSSNAVSREIGELFEKKERQFQSMLDGILHTFLEEMKDTLAEEFAQLSQKEYARLLAALTLDGISNTASISNLYQKNLEIISKMMMEIIQETLKNFTVI